MNNMNISITQVFLSLFLFFALSRVYLRFKGGDLPLVGFFFWSIIFGSAIILVLFPGLTGKIAQIVGIGRGADVVIYVSIALLFYLVFRLYIFLEDIKHEITELIQKLALRDLNENKKGKNKRK